MSDISDNELSIDGRKLVIISILSGLIWVILGNLIIHFVQDSHLAAIFFGGTNVLIQIGSGLGSGFIIGLAGILMIRLPSFKEILDEYAIIRQIKELSLSPVQIVYVSLIAGISEEILFRGAIQPLIGIWWTSLLFIGIHGYIRVQSTTHILYSLFTFGLSMMLGFLFIYFGLISAIAAHF
ncbi:MAG: CPBP family intramembrane glutamic endopeptidase, partial [Balneolaceae bacterium]|nr:CPBP family intramembrane glutamic endopeptidase [Balneolaceae bacterium]